MAVKVIALSVLAMFILTACGAKSCLVNGRPHWYWNPSEGGVIGGVGEAGYHVGGKTAQRQLAVTRALEDIALQKGVNVASVREVNTYETSVSSQTGATTYSIHTIDGTGVNAIIKEIWQEPSSGVIFVWMQEI